MQEVFSSVDADSIRQLTIAYLQNIKKIVIKNILIQKFIFRHCVVAHMVTDGVVTVTPSHPEAETCVNGQRIAETTFLNHGCTVRFGRHHVFRFLDPAQDLRSTSSVTLPPAPSSDQTLEGNYAYFRGPQDGRPVNGYPRPGK